MSESVVVRAPTPNFRRRLTRWLSQDRIVQLVTLPFNRKLDQVTPEARPHLRLAAFYVLEAMAGRPVRSMSRLSSDKRIDMFYYPLHYVNRLSTYLSYVYVILPFFQAPTWCFGRDCGTSSLPNAAQTSTEFVEGAPTPYIPRAQIPYMSDTATLSVDLTCISLFVIWLGLLTLTVGPSLPYFYQRWALFLTAFVDILVSFGVQSRIRLQPFLRPFVFVALTEDYILRLIGVLYSVYNSFAPLVLLWFWIVLFGWLGTIIWSDTKQGGEYFGNPLEGVTTMFISVTTANFPDLFVNAVAENRSSFLFFLCFQIGGVYLLLNSLQSFLYNTNKNFVDEHNQRKERQLEHAVHVAWPVLLKAEKVIQANRRISGGAVANVQRVSGGGAVTSASSDPLLSGLNSVGDQSRSRSATPPPAGVSVESSLNLLKRRSNGNNASNMAVAADELDEVSLATVQQFVESIRVMGNWSFDTAEALLRLDADRSKSINEAEFSQLCQVLKKAAAHQSSLVSFRTTPRAAAHPKLYDFLHKARVRFITMAVVFANLIVLMQLTHYLVSQHRVEWGLEWTDRAFVLVYLIEMGIHFYAEGPGLFFRPSMRALYDRFATLCGLASTIVCWCDIPRRTFELMIILRMVRMGRLLTWHSGWSIYFSAIPRVAVAVSTILIVLVFLFYEFAAWGAISWGGELSPNNPDLNGTTYIDNGYTVLSFNDFSSSMMLLITLMVNNNWTVFMDAFIAVTGNLWPRLFFMVFIMSMGWLVVNIFQNFMIETFTTILDELKIDAAMAKEEIPDLIKFVDKLFPKLGDGTTTGSMTNPSGATAQALAGVPSHDPNISGASLAFTGVATAGATNSISIPGQVEDTSSSHPPQKHRKGTPTEPVNGVVTNPIRPPPKLQQPLVIHPASGDSGVQARNMHDCASLDSPDGGEAGGVAPLGPANHYGVANGLHAAPAVSMHLGSTIQQGLSLGDRSTMMLQSMNVSNNESAEI